MYKKKDVLFRLDFLISKKKKKLKIKITHYISGGKKEGNAKAKRKDDLKKQIKNLNLIFHILHSD